MPLKSQESRANFVHSNWDVKPDETHLLIRAELVVINFLKNIDSLFRRKSSEHAKESSLCNRAEERLNFPG